MELNEINGRQIKMGKTSITVLTPETGKTQGIIRDVERLMSVSPRRLYDYAMKYKSILDESRQNNLFSNFIVKDCELYYLNDQHLQNFIMRSGHPEWFENEIAKTKKLQVFADKVKTAGVTAIDCEIVR